eukprot:COSAG02_NODE_1923_length_10327_cov_6.211501_3_plen_253_part_00
MNIYLHSQSSAAEQWAAQELSGFIGNATGSSVPITSYNPTGPGLTTLAVGYRSATESFCGLPADQLMGLGNESFVISSSRSGVKPGFIAVAGGEGSQRGTIYAAYQLLRLWGFRFFAPDLTTMPNATSLAAALSKTVDVTFRPQMEFRTLESYETDGGPAPADTLWEVRNGNNDCDHTDKPGGCVKYASPPGGVHTSYSLLGDTAATNGGKQPPAALFKANPECACLLTHPAGVILTHADSSSRLQVVLAPQ